MKITKFTIKNYRSIKEIKDFQLLDNRTTCFVGPNGSGKSNILKAIAAVKNYDFLTENDFYAKDQPEPIYIEVDFLFSQEDQSFFEEKGINFTDIDGARVIINKEPGQAKPSEEIIPLGFNDKTDKSKQKIYEILEDIINLTNNLDVPEEQKQLKLDIDTKLKEFASIGKEELIQKLPELKTLIEAIRPYGQQYC
jgi:AAA15 family ATPase/GTPase